MSLKRLKDIISRIKHEDTRWDAILELKLLNDPEIVDPLMVLLGDRDWVVRWCVAEKLGDMGNPKAIFLLIKRLNDKDFHVRRTAAKALEKFGKVGIPGLVKQFSHHSPDVRAQAFLILKHFGASAIPDLEEALVKVEWVVANRIVHTIWHIGGPLAEDALIRCVYRRAVQKNSIMILAVMKSKKGIPYLLKAYDMLGLKRCVIGAFKQLGPDIGYPVLVKIACSADAKFITQAQAIIIRIGDPMLKYLIKALTVKECNKKVIIYLIKKIGPEKVMKYIYKFAEQDKEIRALTADIRAKHSGKDKKRPGGILGILGM
jgi:hypothetical protein